MSSRNAAMLADSSSSVRGSTRAASVSGPMSAAIE